MKEKTEVDELVERIRKEKARFAKLKEQYKAIAVFAESAAEQASEQNSEYFREELLDIVVAMDQIVSLRRDIFEARGDVLRQGIYYEE